MLDILKPPSSPFEQPSIPHRILSSPLKYIVQHTYAFQLYLRGSSHILPPEDQCIRVLCIADTHCHKPTSLPPADLLIHAGDLTNDGTAAQVQDQIDWLAKLDYKYKIVIAGNHDGYLDPRSRHLGDSHKEIEWPRPEAGLHYLQHSSVTLTFLRGGSRVLKIYGAPQIPACGGPEFAFQYPREQDAWRDTIPVDTDVLVSHSPPRHHLDLPRGMGCEWLLREAWKVKPKLHVFGHVHCGYGRECVFWDQAQATYERLCDRKERGMLRDFVAIWAWIDVMKLLVHSTIGVLWNRVWGGYSEGTLMVNAALMLGSTGKLGNKPQIVKL